MHIRKEEFYFDILNEKINQDFHAYKSCPNTTEDLSCGRNITKYRSPLVIAKEHKSYIDRATLHLCNNYNIIECSNCFIYIGVLTRPELVYERMIVRRIMLNIENIKYSFISGRTLYENITKLLLTEIELYHDIIIFDVLSSYYNCSLIMSCFYLYTYKTCTNIKWIMKLDIDTYFNITMIFSIIKYLNNNISVIGSIRKYPRLPCSVKAKWSVLCSNKTFSYINYPSYPYGPGFLFKATSLRCIFIFIIQEKKIIWIEDAMFGDIMQHCKLNYFDISKYSEISYKQKNNLSILRNKVFIHGLHPIEILLNSLYKP